MRRMWQAFRDAFWKAFNASANPAPPDVFEKGDLRPEEAWHTAGGDCWCTPSRICVVCKSQPPCEHGTGRHEAVLHKRAS